MKGRTWLVWIALACAAACSDANVSGNYTVALTNGTDGCSMGWNVNQQVTTSFTVNQSDSNVDLMVNGVIESAFLGVWIGTNRFPGEVDGDDVDLDVIGTPTHRTGACEYTIDAELTASLDGDTLKGGVNYRAKTNDSGDCGSREGCVSKQSFNATRSPAAPQ
jgi:hypothetical protein